MVDREDRKPVLRTILALIGFFLVVGALITLLGVLVPRKPQDPPATPLTAQQLSQHPLLIHPQAADIVVRRDAGRFGPDQPRPDRLRFYERITTYRTAATPSALASYYREFLATYGWHLCGQYEAPTAYVYQPSGTTCVSEAPEAILITIVAAADTGMQSVKVVETLPPPLEWPEP